MANTDNASSRKTKIKYMILAIVIAIASWFVVMYTANPDITKKFTGIKVELTGGDVLRDSGYIITDEEDLPKLSVKLRGKRGDLMKAIDNIRIYADVSGISEEGTFYVETSVKLPTNSLSLLKVSETEIPVTAKKQVTKEISLSVYQTGEAEGKLVKTEPATSKVTVMGTEEELELIGGASVTVDISQITEDEVRECEVSIYGKEDVPEESLTTVSLKDPTAKVKCTVYNAKELPIKVFASNIGEFILDEENTTVSPKTVTVGVSDNDNPQSVSVTIVEFTEEEGEYELNDSEGIYIPDSSRKVKVTPVWKKII